MLYCSWRPHGDSRALHVDEKKRDAAVLRYVGVGSRQDHAAVGVAGEARPHLLTGDQKGVSVGYGAGLERGQVRAGVRLRKALAPDLLGREDRLQEALFLRLGAV